MQIPALPFVGMTNCYIANLLVCSLVLLVDCSK